MTDHAKSMLPAGKKWKLVWHDEFDGTELDRTKWDFRLHLLQQRHNTFTDEGAVLDGKGNLLLTLIEKDGQFYKGTLRGRQVLESEQSIVIIGDVEDGATVASKGNVIVTGTIYGTVIAGAAGRTDAVIAALHMQPKKLRIGGIKVKPVIGGSYSWAKLL